jgi:hypothetical protein
MEHWRHRLSEVREWLPAYSPTPQVRERVMLAQTRSLVSAQGAFSHCSV